MLHSFAKDLLLQLDGILSECKEEDFSKPLEELSGATFGQHVRHTLEFFMCLFNAKKEGVINYERRNHDKLMETDKKLAQCVISSIKEFLSLNKEDFQVTFEVDYSEIEDQNVTMKSSFYRELSYNIEHAIHHMALMKVAIKQSLTYISLPDHFGMAVSTVRYQAGLKK